ncbi:MAG TPA: hypothetical protein VIH83_03565, partial [Candidatus Bathyarchaeia archaeon]
RLTPPQKRCHTKRNQSNLAPPECTDVEGEQDGRSASGKGQPYSESRIQEAILALLDKGLIETVYPCGLEIGFRPLKSEKWFFSRPGVVEKWNPG